MQEPLLPPPPKKPVSNEADGFLLPPPPKKKGESEPVSQDGSGVGPTISTLDKKKFAELSTRAISGDKAAQAELDVMKVVADKVAAPAKKVIQPFDDRKIDITEKADATAAYIPKNLQKVVKPDLEVGEFLNTTPAYISTQKEEIDAIKQNFGTRTKGVDFDALAKSSKKSETPLADMDAGYTGLEDDYLDYLQATNPDLAEYNRNKAQALREKKNLTDDEKNWLVAFRNEAIEKRNLAAEATMWGVKETSDVKEWQRRSAEIAAEIKGIDRDIEELGLNPDGNPPSKIQSAQGLIAKRDLLVKEYEGLDEKTGFTPEKQEEYFGAAKELIGGEAYMRGSMDVRFPDMKVKRDEAARMKEARKETAEIPVVGQVSGLLDGIFGTVANMQASMFKLPKVLGDALGDNDYRAFDEMYSLATDYQGDLDKMYGNPFGKNDVPPTGYEIARMLGEGVGSVGMFVAGGELAALASIPSRVGVVGTAFLTGTSDFYEEAIAAGMNPKEAARTAIPISAIVSSIEGIVPDVKYIRPSAFRRSVIRGITEGKTITESLQGAIRALPDATRSYLDAAIKEGVEEGSAQLAGDISKEVSNSISDNKFLDVWDEDAYKQAIMAGALTGGVLNVFSRPKRYSASPIQEEVLGYAVDQAENGMPEPLDPKGVDQQREIVEQALSIKQGLQGAPSFKSLQKPVQNHLVAELLRKKKLEEGMRNSGVKPESTLAEIEKIENEVKSILDTGMTITEQSEAANKAKAEPEVKAEQVELSPENTGLVTDEVQAGEVAETPVAEGVAVEESPAKLEKTEQKASIDKVETNMPLAKEIVDGRVVRESIPNESSIESSLSDYMELGGIREVKMSEIKDTPQGKTTSNRVKKLANEIRESNEINPLIVVVDKDGPYVLEGNHRIDALHELGAKSFPAKVVIDLESFKESESDAGEKYDAAKRFRNEIWIPHKRGEITGKEANEMFDKLSKETGISHVDIQNTAADYGDFTRPRPTPKKIEAAQTTDTTPDGDVQPDVIGGQEVGQESGVQPTADVEGGQGEVAKGYYIKEGKEFVKVDNAKPVKLDVDGDFFSVRGENGFYTIYEGTSGQAVARDAKLLRDAIKNANEAIERNAKAGFTFEMAISGEIRRDGKSPRYAQDVKENTAVSDLLNEVNSGRMNADEASIKLDESGVEVSNEVYDQFREAEANFNKGNRRLQVGDTVTVKGKNGVADFKGNFRGVTNDGKYVVVGEDGYQNIYDKSDILEQPAKTKPVQQPRTEGKGEVDALKDVESTAKALDSLTKKADVTEKEASVFERIKKAFFPKNSVRLMHGSDVESLNRDDDGLIWFTDNRKTAEEYRKRAVVKNNANLDEYDEDTIESKSAIETIADEQGINLDSGRVFVGQVDIQKPLDLTSPNESGNIESVEDLWNKLYEYGLVENWNDVDADYQQELIENYEGRAVWKLLEDENVYENAKKAGFDAIIITDVGVDGIPHKSYGVFGAKKFFESSPKAFSEAYHAAKKDGSNPELVKAVEELLSPVQETPVFTEREQEGSVNEGVKLSPAKKKAEELRVKAEAIRKSEEKEVEIEAIKLTPEETKIIEDVKITKQDAKRAKSASPKRTRKSKSVVKAIENQAKDVETSPTTEGIEETIQSIEVAEAAILSGTDPDESFEKKYGVSEVDLLNDYNSRDKKTADLGEAYDSLTGRESNFSKYSSLESDKLAYGQFVSDFVNSVTAQGLKIKNPISITSQVTVSIPETSAKPLKTKGVESMGLVVGDDAMRPNYESVFIEDGTITATDGNVLVSIKKNQSDNEIIDWATKSNEKSWYKSFGISEAKKIANKNKAKLQDGGLVGKMIHFKSGQITEGRYMDYKSVIPKDRTQKAAYQSSELADIAYSAEVALKAIKTDVKQLLFKVENADKTLDFEIAVNPELFKIAVQALQANGNTEIEISFEAPNRAILLEGNNGGIALVMPLMIVDDADASIAKTPPIKVVVGAKESNVKKKANALRKEAKSIRAATKGTAMIAPKVYAAALDAFAAILERVDDIAEAIKEWRGTKEYKALADQDRQQIESEFESDFGKDYVPPVKDTSKKEDKSDGVKKTLINRAYTGFTEKEVKDEIERIGLDRQIESHEQAVEAGKELIERVGIDNALDMVLDGTIKGAPAAFIYSTAIDAIEVEIANETDEVRRGFLARKEAELLEAFGLAGTFGGQFNSMLNWVYANSDLGYNYEKKIQQYSDANNGVVPEDIKAKFKEYDAKIKELQKKIKEAEEKAKYTAAQEAVTDIKEDIERKAKVKPKAKEAAKKLANEVRKAKLSRPTMFMSATPAAVVWDTAVEAVALAIEGGATIADAIAKGVASIRSSKWYQGLSSDKQIEAEIAFEDGFSDIKRKDAEVEVIDGRMKIPSKVVREIVESGVENIDDVVAAIREKTGDTLVDFSDRDIRDAITGYGKKVNPRRDDIERKVNEAKAIGRLLSKIEDLENGIKKQKNPDQRQRMSEEVKRLRKQADALSRGLITEDEKIDRAKAAIKKQIEEYERRLKEKDFTRKPPPDPMLDNNELSKLRREKQKVKEQFDLEINKAELKNRSGIRKFWDGVFDVWALPRAVMATGEMSFVLIQGLVQTIAHPKRAMRAFKKAFEHFGSEKKASEWGDFVKSQPYYDLMKASKLSLSEFDARLAAREEQFLGGMINHIWDLGGYAPDVWKKANPIKALERATVGYLNTMRILGFIEGIQMLEKQGKTFAKNPKNYNDLADVMNTFTGRSGLGKFENLSKLLSFILFSPKNWASIIKQTTPLGFYWLGRMTDEGMRPSVAQKVAMRDYMIYVTTTMTVVAMAAMYLNNDDDEETGVETDPTSSDFGKIKLGDQRIDPWGGRVQMITFMARMLSESVKNPTSGEVRLLGERPTDPDRLELAGRLVKQKLAPSAGIVVRYWQTREKRGERVDDSDNVYTPSEEVMNMYPIYWGTLKELYEEEPFLVEKFFTLGVYGFLGGGIGTYGTLDDVSEREFNKLRDAYRRENKGKSPVGSDLRTMQADAKELAVEKIAENKRKREINENLNPQYAKIDKAIKSGVGDEDAVRRYVENQDWFADLDEKERRYVMSQLRGKYLIPMAD
jgi:hypothetical protein